MKFINAIASLITIGVFLSSMSFINGFVQKQMFFKIHGEEYIENEIDMHLGEIKKDNPDFSSEIDIEINDFDFTMQIKTDALGKNSMTSSVSEYNPGEYHLSNSIEGEMLLSLISLQLDKFIDKDNNSLIITIKALGTADGTPVNDSCRYNGSLGDSLFIDYYYLKDTSKIITECLKKGNSMKNKHFALLRAVDVVQQLEDRNEIEKKNIKIYIHEYSEIGGDKRRCDLSITVENAFLKDFNNLPLFSRVI